VTLPRSSALPRRRTRRFPLALLGLVLVVPALGYASAPAASAAPRPKPPVELFVEDFQTAHENPVSLSAYVGEAPVSERYTADRAWLTHCNGTVVGPTGENDTSPHTRSNGCVPSAYTNALQLNEVLSDFGAISADQANNSLSARTDQPGQGYDPGAGKVQFETVAQVPIDRLTNRFVGVGAITAAMNCGRAGYRSAQLDFRLKTGATGQTVTRTLGDPRYICNNRLEVTAAPIPTKLGAAGKPIPVRVGRTYSANAYLFSGTRVGIQIVNAEGSGTGNDVSMDDISVLDMTPRLAATFDATSIALGETTGLRLDVINSTDRAQKDGYGFAVTLPAGLEVAPDPAIDRFCGDRGNAGITPGATRFTIKGLLYESSQSCAVTIQVRATSRGSKVLAPGVGITSLVGIDPSASATLTVS
jgi:hypothetical protein